MSMIRPCLIRSVAGGEVRALRLGHPLLDDYLEFVAARARANTLLAQAFDLKVFFSVVAKEPSDVTTADVLAFINAQREPRRGPRWCASRMARSACQHGRSSDGWPRSSGCSTTWSFVATPE